MNDTTFSCGHFYSHSFLSAGKESEMSKRSQESSSPVSPTVKANACCLVSRHCVSVGQDNSSNLKNPGSTRDSQVWTREERNEKSGWYSVQHASGNREYSSEDSGGLAETHASGNREYTRKVVQNIEDQLRHDESISEKSINSEDAFFDLDKIYGFINAGSIAHGTSYEKNLALFKNSEFENIKGLFGITRMMIEGNSEIKNVFLADVASSLWENPVLLKEQAIKWTKARVYVCSDSVLCLGKMRGPEDAVRRWNDQVSTLKVCPTFREL